jgi:hypothetical protein
MTASERSFIIDQKINDSDSCGWLSEDESALSSSDIRDARDVILELFDFEKKCDTIFDLTTTPSSVESFCHDEANKRRHKVAHWSEELVCFPFVIPFNAIKKIS